MSWKKILKRKLTVMEAVVEINDVLSGYKNVEKESWGHVIDGYRNEEIINIYDNFAYGDDQVPKQNNHKYYIQCNVYDKEQEEKYTGVLFATHLDKDTKEVTEFFEKAMKLSFNDELEDAKEWLETMNDDWM